MDSVQGDRTVVRISSRGGRRRLRFAAGLPAGTVLDRVLRALLEERRRDRGARVDAAPPALLALLDACGIRR